MHMNVEQMEADEEVDEQREVRRERGRGGGGGGVRWWNGEFYMSRLETVGWS